MEKLWIDLDSGYLYRKNGGSKTIKKAGLRAAALVRKKKKKKKPFFFVCQSTASINSRKICISMLVCTKYDMISNTSRAGHWKGPLELHILLCLPCSPKKKKKSNN